MTKLKQWLGEQGTSVSAFARQTGISQSYMWEIVNDVKKPSLRAAKAIDVATGGGVPMQCWVRHDVRSFGSASSEAGQ